MATQFLGFGNGSDGVATLSGTDAPIDSSCSGSAGSTSLSATNASFSAGQIVMIHQTRGTGVGQWEINQIASYVAGTITLVRGLDYTYTNSGASIAQVLVLKQYSQVTVSGTLTAKAWNGTVGGIIAFLCSGKVAVSGTITANGGAGATTGVDGDNQTVAGGTGGGFRGGTGRNDAQDTKISNAAEGTAGAEVAYQNAANGNGGGGGGTNVDESPHGGGGGGNASAGSTGGGSSGGVGGASTGVATLVTMTFGGGGGGGWIREANRPASGGSGGGIVMIFCSQLEVTGSITVNGGAGGATAGDVGGGGGAGGCIFLKARTMTLGSSLVAATGGAGGDGAQDGGTGSVGRIRIEACGVTGTTNPAQSEVEGGFSFCGSAAQIYSS